MMLIETLGRIQARERMTDGVIAWKLGIHAMSWNRLKKGRSGYSTEFIAKALAGFPGELEEAVLRDIFGPGYRRVVSAVMEKLVAEVSAAAAPAPETKERV